MTAASASTEMFCVLIREHGHQAQPTPDGEEIVATTEILHLGGMVETVIELICPTRRDVRNWLGY